MYNFRTEDLPRALASCLWVMLGSWAGWGEARESSRMEGAVGGCGGWGHRKEGGALALDRVIFGVLKL